MAPNSTTPPSKTPHAPHPLGSALTYRAQLVSDAAHVLAYAEELLLGQEGVLSTTLHYQDEQPRALEIHFNTPESLAAWQALLHSDEVLKDHPLAPLDQLSPEDWAESWKRFWHASRITPHLMVCPSWEEAPVEPGVRVLRLDPGCAFGTGTHATTQLMLHALEALTEEHPETRNLPWLDVGTGSGILALYAAMLGAPEVLGIDNDPLAVQAAQENVARCGAPEASRVVIRASSLEELPEQHYGVILMNIIAPVIHALLPSATQRAQENAYLLLSGVIPSQEAELQKHLLTLGWTPLRTTAQGEWLAMVCSRHANTPH